MPKAPLEKIRELRAELASGPRCPTTGNPCGTDTWSADNPPDCHCGKLQRRIAELEEISARAINSNQKYYRGKVLAEQQVEALEQRIREGMAGGVPEPVGPEMTATEVLERQGK